ncbi:hypothetical protein CRE_24194 [Caenorhabditis remanei]|uniref:Uncharacterized protein n=1 Tax=Caenorhabditis remanei TaxID=31234 RepID=E3N995_CAERE|nr:hypothetical protein CRE_24194 [Caenorhabditis remanei]
MNRLPYYHDEARLQYTIEGIELMYERKKRCKKFADTLYYCEEEEKREKEEEEKKQKEEEEKKPKSPTFFEKLKSCFFRPTQKKLEAKVLEEEKPDDDDDTRTPFYGQDEEFEFLLKALRERLQMRNGVNDLQLALDKEMHSHLITLSKLLAADPSCAASMRPTERRLRESIESDKALLTTLKSENTKLKRDLTQYKWDPSSKRFISQLQDQLESANRQIDMMVDHHELKLKQIELDHGADCEGYVLQVEKKKLEVKALKKKVAEQEKELEALREKLKEKEQEKLIDF